jgi:hypothetical protein
MCISDGESVANNRPGGFMDLRRSALFALAAMAAGVLPATASSRSHEISIADASKVAVRHMQADPAEFGVKADDVSRMRVASAYRSEHNRVTHVYLRQQMHGLDVLTGDVTVNVLRDGSILHVGSRLIADVAERSSGVLRLEATDAVRAAAIALGLEPLEDPTIEAFTKGPERETLVAGGDLSMSDIPMRLVYHPVGNQIRLGWELEIEEFSQQHWWNAVVDAETGSLIAKYDYVIHEDEHDIVDRLDDLSSGVGRNREPIKVSDTVGPGNDGASYRVYALPLESPNDGPRTLVTNPADPIASPFGWHDDDGVPGPEYNITRGNNVHAYADVTGAGASNLATEANSGPLGFDYEIDFSQPPLLWKDAAITNLFYWNNIIHDVLFHYGFDSPAGNFQEDRYGQGGLGNDYVRAEGQDSAGVNNANFATPRDGNPPRMQMYLWPSTRKRAVLDGDLDNGVIIHEYGHGVSNRLTGGPHNVECLRNQEQAGEGWSDWLAIALTALPTDEPIHKRGLGTYVSGEDHRRAGGIRPTPYWIVSPSPTYDSVKSAVVPHGVGWVWAAILWEVYWNLVFDHGFNPDVYDSWDTGGNNLAIQLVMDGMKMQHCSPGFVDSRDGILAADVALTGGANRCTLWRAFAKRGLGEDAIQGSSNSVTDGKQGFAVPADC